MGLANPRRRGQAAPGQPLQAGVGFTNTSLAPVPVQTGTGAIVMANQPVASFLGISATPVFTQPTVSSQLNLNPAQLSQLAQSYGQFVNRFNNGAPDWAP